MVFYRVCIKLVTHFPYHNKTFKTKQKVHRVESASKFMYRLFGPFITRRLMSPKIVQGLMVYLKVLHFHQCGDHWWRNDMRFFDNRPFMRETNLKASPVAGDHAHVASQCTIIVKKYSKNMMYVHFKYLSLAGYVCWQFLNTLLKAINTDTESACWMT